MTGNETLSLKYTPFPLVRSLKNLNLERRALRGTNTNFEDANTRLVSISVGGGRFGTSRRRLKGRSISASGHSRRLQSTRIASGLHQKANLPGYFAFFSVEASLEKNRKRLEAKRPGQPKSGQGRAAGFAGRAEGASLDRVPVVRQRSSRRSWLGLSQICGPVRQAANGAICDVDLQVFSLRNTAGLWAVPSRFGGARADLRSLSLRCGEAL